MGSLFSSPDPPVPTWAPPPPIQYRRFEYTPLPQPVQPRRFENPPPPANLDNFGTTTVSDRHSYLSAVPRPNPVPDVQRFVLKDAVRQDKPVQSCQFFLQGRCRFGDKCKRAHVTPKQGTQENAHSTTVNRQNKPESSTRLNTVKNPRTAGSQMQNIQANVELNPSSTSTNHSKFIARPVPDCHAWKAGMCPRGNRCRFAHNPEAQEAENILVAQLEEEEASKTVDQLIFSSTRVTFGAGVSVIRVVTGFQSSRVIVRNLPLNANKHEVVNFFTQPGFDRSRFTVLGLRQMTNHQDATVAFDDAEDARNAVLGLDGMEFGDKTLKLEIFSKEEELGASKGEPNTLTITWPAPSISAVATYDCLDSARRKVRELDGKICDGRRVRVEMNRRPDTLPEAYFNSASVKITGLPAEITTGIIQQIFGSSNVKQLKSRTYDLPAGLRLLRALINGPGLSNFDSEPVVSEAGMVSAKARFNTWDRAKQAHERLENVPLGFFGGAKCYVSLAEPLHYSKSIPPQQFKAQETAFRSIVDSVQKGEKVGARARLFPAQDGRFARIEISGSDKKVVGSLKVRVERLVAGEKLEYWDRFFWSKEGEAYLASVSRRTEACIRRDGHAQVLKAFGEPGAVEAAKALIKAEVERLSSLEFSLPLKRISIKFFVKQGVATLKELVGEDNVRLDLAASSITIRGGEDAKHSLRNLIEQSLAPTSTLLNKPKSGETCPVCFDDIDSPFRLACGHTYCTSCLRHFLTTACDTKQFPVVCIGDGGKCGRSLPIPTIQKFLPPAQINRLFEVSFLDYLDRHPKEYKYCATPDCPQIYRLEQGLEVVNCPACFASACLTCDEDHEGFTCTEWKIHRDPEEQERLFMGWAEENSNVKKCPNCRALIEKNGGCNHMTCIKCKAHICWICLGMFEPRDIYNHMAFTHNL